MSLSSDPTTVDAAAAASASTSARPSGGAAEAAPSGGANLRLALILASVAAAFFVGIVVKYVFFPAP